MVIDWGADQNSPSPGNIQRGLYGINDGENINAINAGFGSWHAGVCNFVMGDGAVKAMSNTTAYRILACLSTCDDGISVTP